VGENVQVDLLQALKHGTGTPSVLSEGAFQYVFVGSIYDGSLGPSGFEGMGV